MVPCLGPTLGAILSSAASADTVGTGGVLLAGYGVGLAIPFLLCALLLQRAMGPMRWFTHHHKGVSLVSGLILIAFGLLLATGELPGSRPNSPASSTTSASAGSPRSRRAARPSVRPPERAPFAGAHPLAGAARGVLPLGRVAALHALRCADAQQTKAAGEHVAGDGGERGAPRLDARTFGTGDLQSR